VRLEEIQPIPVVDGTLLWQPIRRTLDVGGHREDVYEPSPWEDFFAAERHRAAGDYQAYAEELSAALTRRPDHPATLYNLACAETLAGRTGDALLHLRRALEQRPEWKERAREDDDLAPLRDAPEWPA
jgi:tetratricopeptide (TPR) repeat protein